MSFDSARRIPRFAEDTAEPCGLRVQLTVAPRGVALRFDEDDVRLAARFECDQEVDVFLVAAD